MIHKAEVGLTLLLIAVYWTPGVKVKSLIEIFTHIFEKKKYLYDKTFLLGDLKISLTATNDA